MNQEEYVWSVTLDKKNLSDATWCPLNAEDGGEDDNIIHKLHIRNAFLTSKAKKDDDDELLHLITLETTGLKDELVQCPLVMIKGNSKPQVPIGQTFNRQVKLSLTEGTGPVVLVGSHILEIGTEKDNSEDNNEILYGEASEGEETDVEEQDEEEEEEEEEDEEMTEEEDSPVKPKKPSKKPVSNGAVKNGKKRKAVEDHEDEDSSEGSPKESKRKVSKKQKVNESNGAKNKSKKSNK